MARILRHEGGFPCLVVVWAPDWVFVAKEVRREGRFGVVCRARPGESWFVARILRHLFALYSVCGAKPIAPDIGLSDDSWVCVRPKVVHGIQRHISDASEKFHGDAVEKPLICWILYWPARKGGAVKQIAKKWIRIPKGKILSTVDTEQSFPAPYIIRGRTILTEESIPGVEYVLPGMCFDFLSRGVLAILAWFGCANFTRVAEAEKELRDFFESVAVIGRAILLFFVKVLSHRSFPPLAPLLFAHCDRSSKSPGCVSYSLAK